MDTPRVRLRDVTVDDADMLDAWAADPELIGGFNDFGIPRGPVDREVLALGPMRNERNGQLIVEVIDGSTTDRDGLLAPGRLRAGRRVGRAGTSASSSIAEARGHGYGVEAQVLVARFLFEHTPANRVEAQTDIENIAEQRALDKAGFVREGVAARLAVPRRRLPRPRDLLDPAGRRSSSTDGGCARSDVAERLLESCDLGREIERSAVLAVGRRLGIDAQDRAVRGGNDRLEVGSRAPMREA